MIEVFTWTQKEPEGLDSFTSTLWHIWIIRLNNGRRGHLPPFRRLATGVAYLGRHVVLRGQLVHGGVCHSPGQVCEVSVCNGALRSANTRQRWWCACSAYYVQQSCRSQYLFYWKDVNWCLIFSVWNSGNKGITLTTDLWVYKVCVATNVLLLFSFCALCNFEFWKTMSQTRIG